MCAVAGGCWAAAAALRRGTAVELVGLEVVKSKLTSAGARYRLSDGQLVPMLDLIANFVFLGRQPLILPLSVSRHPLHPA